MGYQYIIYEKEDAIARITLNKPEKLNAFSFIGTKWGSDAEEIWNAFDEAARDDEVKVVILKGAGRAFCAGHDLTKVGFVYGWEQPPPGQRSRPPSQKRRLAMDRASMYDGFAKVLYCPKITIAQVHSYCLGAGMIVASLCDITVAGDDAKFGHPQERMTFAGAGGVNLVLLSHQIGLKRARELSITGRIIDAAEAERIGLVNKVVPAAELEETVDKMAKAATLLPADGIAIGKAFAELAYDTLGIKGSWTQCYIGHTFATNLTFQEGEFNFFKARRDKGAKAAFHERDEQFSGLV